MYLCLLFLQRTILAALHFNYNLKKETKVDEERKPILRVTYPKFKEGEATVKEAKVSANYGNNENKTIQYFLTSICRSQYQLITVIYFF